jgi:hypothetical protein
MRIFFHSPSHKHVELSFVRPTGGNGTAKSLANHMDVPGMGSNNGGSFDVPVPHRRDGLLRLLLWEQPQTAAEIDTSRHLVRLLKRPSQNADNTAMVAVPQGRCGLGDLHNKENRARPKLTGGDQEKGSLETTPIGGERLLPVSGLAEGEEHTHSYSSQNLFGPMEALKQPEIHDVDSPDRDCKVPEQEGILSSATHKFPPSPPKGPWWKELLASPVKKLKLGTWSHKIRIPSMPDLSLPPLAEKKDEFGGEEPQQIRGPVQTKKGQKPASRGKTFWKDLPRNKLSTTSQNRA